MVTLDENKENFTATEQSSTNDVLREERKRTGRYVATVISIFVSLYGLYQALTRGTPEYAAFFLPALIMFFYLFWILYASKSLSKIANESIEDLDKFEEIKIESNPERQQKPTTSRNPPTVCRSYSIA